MEQKGSLMKKVACGMTAMILLLIGIGGEAFAENEYQNPIIPADYSDPDVIRVGNDYYMTASSFNMVPGLPVLHSKDLVHWTLIGHGIQRLPDALIPYPNRNVHDLNYDRPRLGRGAFAPSIRYHEGWYWIFWADPDGGIYQVKAKNPAGPWGEPVLVHKASGIIDPSPLWDSKTGKAYLSHAYAASRAGFNERIDVWEMTPDGTQLLGDPVTIFDTKQPDQFPADRHHSIIEGTKFMQRGDWYYVLCPAGSVEIGWQTALRSKNPMGPYEIRTVCETGNTGINGPHQGGLVDTPAGAWWFIHFQSAGTLGRIVWLEPAAWENGWPVMGVDPDGNGIGNPVHHYKAPLPFVPKSIQMSDDFPRATLGLQWQWPANPKPDWATIKDDSLILPAQFAGHKNLADIPSVLTQMFPDFNFSATAHMDLNTRDDGVRAGLATMGRMTFDIGLQRAGKKYEVSVRFQNTKLATARLPSATCWLRLETTGEPPFPLKSGRTPPSNTVPPFKRDDLDPWKNGHLSGQFSYSTNGTTFIKLGQPFEVRSGRWIGARIGLFCLKTDNESSGTGNIRKFIITNQ